MRYIFIAPLFIAIISCASNQVARVGDVKEIRHINQDKVAVIVSGGAHGYYCTEKVGVKEDRGLIIHEAGEFRDTYQCSFSNELGELKEKYAKENWIYEKSEDRMSGEFVYSASKASSTWRGMDLVIVEGDPANLAIVGPHTFDINQSKARVRIDDKLLEVSVGVNNKDGQGFLLFGNDSKKLIQMIKNAKTVLVEARLNRTGNYRIIEFKVDGLAKDIKNPEN